MLKYYRKEKNETSEVPTDVWFSYFKNLNEKKSSSENIKEQLIDMEKVKTFTELDNLITKTEIEKAISSLKNNKASGFDSILNEMIKSSQIYLISCYQVFFKSGYLRFSQFSGCWLILSVYWFMSFHWCPIKPINMKSNVCNSLNYSAQYIGCHDWQ